MTAADDRYWAVLARQLKHAQLAGARRQAEGWRAGLSGLTGLLAVLVVLKGRDSLDGLPDGARLLAGCLVGAAFLLLLTGTVLAVRAAHGRPGERILLTGGRLRAWTEGEVARVGRRLREAAWCCLVGVLLAAAAVVVAWTTTTDPPGTLVRVVTPAVTVCGELVGADPASVSLWTGTGDHRTLRTVPAGTVTPVRACPAP
ncbi:hypothetical protein [Streptomyces sp. NPDC097619]|uniref:hypothetical protein n=1 Tax=Streptomyces sp. NPDC097619 TaxID=3157228 RepID=UPI00332678FC